MKGLVFIQNSQSTQINSGVNVKEITYLVFDYLIHNCIYTVSTNTIKKL